MWLERCTKVKEWRRVTWCNYLSCHEADYSSTVCTLTTSITMIPSSKALSITFKQGHSPSHKLPNSAHFLSPVVEECSKEAGVEVVKDCDEHVLSELEGMRKLPLDLPDAIHKLKEDWRAVSILVAIISMANSLRGRGSDCMKTEDTVAKMSPCVHLSHLV